MDNSWFNSNQNEKNKFLSIFIKLKELFKKGSSHKIQAIQKSFINTIKKGKQFHFTRFFQGTIKDLKKDVERNKENNVFK